MAEGQLQEGQMIEGIRTESERVDIEIKMLRQQVGPEAQKTQLQQNNQKLLEDEAGIAQTAVAHTKQKWRKEWK